MYSLNHYHTVPHLKHLRYIAVENIVRKEEIACNKQFLLFSQGFLPCMALFFLSKCTFKCGLQFVSIWTSLQFRHLVMGNLFPNKLWFLSVCSKSLLKTQWEKEKLLITAISPFPTMFSILLENFPPFSSTSKLLSANSFNLEESKICCLGKG